MGVVKATSSDLSSRITTVGNNERALASLIAENSALRPVSAWSYAFASANYWSSSEFSDTNAWKQNFNNGNQNNNNKDNSNYVRAVRL